MDLAMDLANLLRGNPIIAAVRNKSDLEVAVAGRVGAVFMLGGELLELRGLVSGVRRKGKPIFLHLEFISGLAQDGSAIRFLAEEVRPDGIITTRSHLVVQAKKANLLTIQRLFMLDSLAVKTAISAVRTAEPDALEVLPGIIPRVIRKLSQELGRPLIAGGFIETKEDILQALEAGAVAVSLSKKELWDVDIPKLA